MLASLPPGPYLSHLRELSLDWGLLFRAHALLAQQAQQLTSLFLCSLTCHRGKEAQRDWAASWRQAVHEAVRSFGRMPALQAVTHAVCEGEHALGMQLLAASTLCMLQLAQRYPQLRVDVWTGTGEDIPMGAHCQ